jgi:hypothetical protein
MFKIMVVWFTLTRLFKPITRNEHQNVLEHEVELLKKVA